jgi:hypothetical protein
MSQVATRLDEGALVRLVLERQKFLETVLPPITSIVARRGVVLERTVHTNHTTSRVILRNFLDFSFEHYGHYGMFGGEWLKVWYHPNTSEPTIDPILEVEWWEVKKCHVKRFSRAGKWQGALMRIARDERDSVGRAEREREEAEQRRALLAQQESRRLEIERDLPEYLKRLKLE